MFRSQWRHAEVLISGRFHMMFEWRTAVYFISRAQNNLWNVWQFSLRCRQSAEKRLCTTLVIVGSENDRRDYFVDEQKVHKGHGMQIWMFYIYRRINKHWMWVSLHKSSHISILMAFQQKDCRRQQTMLPNKSPISFYGKCRSIVHILKVNDDILNITRWELQIYDIFQINTIFRFLNLAPATKGPIDIV